MLKPRGPNADGSCRESTAKSVTAEGFFRGNFELSSPEPVALTPAPGMVIQVKRHPVTVRKATGFWPD